MRLKMRCPYAPDVCAHNGVWTVEARRQGPQNTLLVYDEDAACPGGGDTRLGPHNGVVSSGTDELVMLAGRDGVPGAS